MHMNEVAKTTRIAGVGVLLILTLLVGYVLGRAGTGVDSDSVDTETPVAVVADVVPTSKESVPNVSSGTNAVPETVPEVGVVVATLNMSGQELTKLPTSLFERTDLVILNLSHNALTGALPAEIRHLRNLTWLDLSYNQFTGVPAEIGQLSNLRHLDLSHNRLTGLPYELGNLHNLEVLDLTGNDYSEADLAIIRASLPTTTRILGV